METERDLIRKAIYFAARAHCNVLVDGNDEPKNIGKNYQVQVRKGTDIPYIVHPFEVWSILKENNCSTKVQVAGILHDVIEDAEIEEDVIEKEFGKDIRDLVATESEDKSKSWEERKQVTFDHLKDSSDETKMVCCADKLSNARSIAYDYKSLGEVVYDRFNRGKEQQAWYYKGIVNSLKSLSGMPMYEELCKVVKELFG